jgi:hypothetical protein
VYDNTFGFSPKHTSDPAALSYWHLAAPLWTRFWHNTAYRNSEAGIALAENAPDGDYLDVRDNVFDDSGATELLDIPSGRGGHLVVDGDAYVQTGSGSNRYVYLAGWNLQTGGLSRIGDVTGRLGWEQHGMVIPVGGATGAALPQSVDVGDALHGQLGARGPAAAPASFTPYRLVAVASSSRGTWWTEHHLEDSSDGEQETYWMTATAHDEWVTYDLGRARPLNLVVLDVFRHMDNRNVRGYRLATSSDGVHFRTVLAGTNPDSEGSSYKYELRRTVTARYLQLTMVDSFCTSYSPRTGCGPYFVVSDVRAGLLRSRRTG